MACIESVKKFINNNIYSLFTKKEDFEYFLMKDINENNLNEHLMHENDNNTSQIFTIEDENMIRSIIKENNNLIDSCKNNKNEILMSEKEINEVLNNGLTGKS